MFGTKRRLPAAALAGGIVALVALIGCGKEPSVASKSAAAFKEAQKRGETLGGGAHGHGALTPGEGHEMPNAVPESGSAADHAAMAHEGMDHAAMAQGGKDHAAMRQGGMDHSGMAMGGKEHGAMTQETMDHGAMGHEGMDHSGMAMGGMDPAEPAPVAASSGQPAAILRPDALDAPAATSLADAKRSAEMAAEMAGASRGGGHEGHGGHGGHGGGTYVHQDAGREAAAQEGPHQHEGHGMAQEEAAVYTCPMHPEVTSTAPGKCPKCGMTLVKRRKQ